MSEFPFDEELEETDSIYTVTGWVLIFAVIGAISTLYGIGYGIYKLLN